VDREAESTFTQFVLEAGGRLGAFSRMLIADSGDAEDVVQVALMRLARHWGRELDNPEAYVRRVMVNLARDGGRRRHLVPLPTWTGLVRGPTTEDRSSTHEREALEELLTGLPPRQRVAVVLRVIEGYSEAETAALMRCARGTVKSNLARGLERLRANHRVLRATTDTAITNDDAEVLP
jgi:RNA polymerase sigma factor (sigma-70 family)